MIRPGFISLLCLHLVLALTGAQVQAHPDPKHSLTELDQHLAANPSDPQLYLQKAEVLLKIEHLPEAVRAVEEASRLDPEAPGLGYLDACLFAAAGDLSAARKRLTIFLEKEPFHARGQRLLSHLARQQGDLDIAIASAEKTLQASPPPTADDFTYCAGLYLQRQSPGDDDHALKALDAGLAHLGCLTGLHYMACDIELRLHRYDEALRRLDALSARFRPRIEFETKRAEILLQAQRLTEASKAYDNALALLDALPQEQRTSLAAQELRQKLVQKRGP